MKSAGAKPWGFCYQVTDGPCLFQGPHFLRKDKAKKTDKTLNMKLSNPVILSPWSYLLEISGLGPPSLGILIDWSGVGQGYWYF